MEESTLRELLGRMGREDREAARDLFAHAQAPLMRFFMRLCRSADQAEDLVQNTFLKLWTYRGQYQGGGRARGYIYRIALNEWRSRFSRERRHSDAIDQLQHEGTDGDEVPASTQTESEEICAGIMDAIRSLPEEQREVLVLHRFQGFSCREIGELLRRSPKTIESRLRLALEKMTNKLSTLGGLR